MTRLSTVTSELRSEMANRKTLAISNLQIMCFNKGRFWPKKRGVLQKNRGSTETILHFFSWFIDFSCFFQSQPVAFQTQAAIQPLPKKSCQKHYRRFFVRSRMCFNGVVKVGQSIRPEPGMRRMDGDKKPPRLAREAFWTAERQFRFRTTRRNAPLPRTHCKICRPFGCLPTTIKANQS